MVAFCLQHADDDATLPTLARYAASSLAREPVLAGAILMLAQRPGTAESARRLWSACSRAERFPLALLWGFAEDHDAATEYYGLEVLDSAG